jgi:hypothetical protein
MSEGQKRYLAGLFAEQAEQAKANCDCPGCDMCKGHEAGCKCDLDLSGLYLRKAQRDETRTPPTGDGSREVRTDAEDGQAPRVPPWTEGQGYPF